MTHNVFIINAFTDKVFTGNPAAVCLLEGPRDEDWMRKVTREFNQPVTAFVWPVENGEFGVRWYSQTKELRHCGHGTLSSAYVLFEECRIAPSTIHFHTHYSGIFIGHRTTDGIELDFPAFPSAPAEAPPQLERALGVPIKAVQTNHLGYLVEVANAATVKALKPDIPLLGTLPVTGIIVTAKADRAHCDFVSRYFAPSIGIDEDPVTGSAHCALAPYWAPKLGKTVMNGKQISERGGRLKVEHKGDRVLFTGRAVTLSRGELSSEILAG